MKLLTFRDGSWAAAVAQRWIWKLAAEPTLTMVLSSGFTPRPVYELMGEAVSDGRASFAKATVILLNEYGGLPQDDPSRCESMLRRDLLDHVDLPEPSFHHLATDSTDLDAEIVRYGAVLTNNDIDLAIIGLGADGHVGFNQPGSAPDSATRRVELASSPTSEATWGLTLGMSDLMDAHEIWLLATGPDKADVVARLMQEPVTAAVPASYLRGHPNRAIFLDEQAATRVSA